MLHSYPETYVRKIRDSGVINFQVLGYFSLAFHYLICGILLVFIARLGLVNIPTDYLLFTLSFYAITVIILVSSGFKLMRAEVSKRTELVNGLVLGLVHQIVLINVVSIEVIWVMVIISIVVFMELVLLLISLTNSKIGFLVKFNANRQ